MDFKLTIDGFEINLNVSNNPNDWLVVKDDKYRPDRGEFVLERFKKDYPNIKIGDDVEKVYSLASRSSKLAEWLAGINLEYARLQDEPTYYRDYIPSQDYQIVYSDLMGFATKNRQKAAEELAAAKEYRAKMESIEKKYQPKSFGSKFSRVISMNSTELPLTLQLAIENFTPAEGADSPTTKTYARELLTNYKVALINIINNNKNVDINKVIEDGKTK